MARTQELVPVSEPVPVRAQAAGVEGLAFFDSSRGKKGSIESPASPLTGFFSGSQTSLALKQA
ncbi:MAG: hypothetical protein A3H27_07720 [Acidobacteria bacterium RIFCSPLOWO2_02_FULL_59_13]|nr:MAG: hypothetical protein A3H27_07720 [Acidobacteria bacterium RIFCSPLOWO2_02_FULL_59_13]